MESAVDAVRDLVQRPLRRIALEPREASLYPALAAEDGAVAPVAPWARRAASVTGRERARWCALGVTFVALACGSPQAASAPSARGIAPAVAPPSAPSEGATSGARAPQVATGHHGAVSSSERNASEVGLAVLEHGGNAVDAAVAVAFALGVTHPSSGNIGGGGFMLVRAPDGTSRVLDYREVAPGAAGRDMYVDDAGHVTDRGRQGPLAAGIPGVVAGLALAHAKYGTRPWGELLEPAIRLARDGWRLDRIHANEMARAVADMREYLDSLPAREGSVGGLAAALEGTLATFGKPSGQPYAEGDRWNEPALAKTLERIQSDGPDVFYRGALAEQMVAGVRAMGGIWSAEDLRGYRVVEREPITFSYHGYDILAMPPPSAGGIVLRQMLAGYDALDLQRLPWNAVERIHVYVEIARRAYADRNRLLGDPAFVQIPMNDLLDPARAARRMAGIDRQHATLSSAIGGVSGGPVSLHTTHFSVVDEDGLAVANTFTLNTPFGALVQIPETGITLNNEMDDFTAKVGEENLFGMVQGSPNEIAPGKRPLSSMSPTIVSRGGKLRAVLGSPGGPTITTTVAQILVQLLDYGLPLEQAVAAPRIHHQWLPDVIYHEPGVPEATLAALRAMGHAVEVQDPIGDANCIEVDAATGLLEAVADSARGGGAARAY